MKFPACVNLALVLLWNVRACLPDSGGTARSPSTRQNSQLDGSLRYRTRLALRGGYEHVDEPNAMEEQAMKYADMVDMHSRDAADFIAEWKPVILQVMKASKDTIWILDFGCGTAPYVDMFLSEWQDELAGRARIRLVCCDPDFERLKVAEQLHRDRLERSELVLLHGDHTSLAKLVAENNIPGFDLIVSSYVFHFIRDKDTCIATLSNALRPGGHLMITTTEDTCDDSLPARVLTAMRPCSAADVDAIAIRNARVQSCFIESGDSLSAAALRVGCGRLQALNVTAGDVEYRYNSLEHMYRWFFAMTHGAFDASLIPPERREELRLEHPGEVVLRDRRFRAVFRRV